ncbi:hypothetical protein FBY24_3718 [Cellulomonas sp. SLBN-39]|nr:hypothetical protein FBY24_3718 [Cellulomonas sp. SLBN-39]
MSRFTDAVSWSGRGVTLILFAVFPADASIASLERVGGQVQPRDVRRYRLDDVDRRLGGRQCYEWDLAFDAVPSDAEGLVSAWLAAALDAGAEFAWFAFEGSFSFNHILTVDVADQVFAVGGSAGIDVAIDDRAQVAAGWVATITAVRERAGL